MQVKTYTGKSPADALTRIKAELGDDAVILSNKTVEENGSKHCEIVVGIESYPAVEGSFAESLAQAGRRGRDRVSISTAAAARRNAVWGGNGTGARTNRDDYLTDALDGSSHFSREWRQIKRHFLSLMKSQLDFEALAPRQRVAMEYLEREGVSEIGLAQVYRRLIPDPEQAVLPVLEELVRAKPFGPRTHPEKFHFLAGPHGVGKTSCTLRLGLAAKRENSKTRVCLVSAGNGGGGGRKILRHYAELSGLAFREAVSAEDFQALFAEARSFDLVLIDLPGLERGRTLADWMEERGLAPGRDTALHLVLSPHYAPAQMETFLDQYQGPGAQSLIWTKLDEACTFGELVNTAQLSGLPVSALSYGPGLTDGLAAAEPEALWRLFFKHELPRPGRTAKEKHA